MRLVLAIDVRQQCVDALDVVSWNVRTFDDKLTEFH